MTPLQEVLLRTLCYADIFDYPLTREEIRKFQVSNLKTRTKSKFQIPNFRYIQTSGRYYFLSGRNAIVTLRRVRERHARRKQEIARRFAVVFKLIPAIRMVGVTGAVAAGNAEENDDIDLLIVSSSGWIWTTRFLAIILTGLLGIRRKPDGRDNKNKLCLNMFVDESHLRVPAKEQDLFSAHEVAQMKMLWGRGDVEKRFYENNRWILTYLPNSMAITKLRNKEIKTVKNNFPISKFPNFIELGLELFQLTYMKSRRTNEVVRDGYLRFHPKDARKWILKKYKRNLQKYGLEMV